MKKIFLVLFALLLVAGAAYAAVNLPVTIDPQNGPSAAKATIYYNSATAASEGDVLVFDVGSSTGDDDLYATTTTTSDTAIVVGVAYTAISAYSPGEVVIGGTMTRCNTIGPVAAGTMLCTSGTAGKAKACTTVANAFGYTTATSTTSGSTHYSACTIF